MVPGGFETRLMPCRGRHPRPRCFRARLPAVYAPRPPIRRLEWCMRCRSFRAVHSGKPGRRPGNPTAAALDPPAAPPGPRRVHHPPFGLAVFKHAARRGRARRRIPAASGPAGAPTIPAGGPFRLLRGQGPDTPALAFGVFRSSRRSVPEGCLLCPACAGADHIIWRSRGRPALVFWASRAKGGRLPLSGHDRRLVYDSRRTRPFSGHARGGCLDGVHAARRRSGPRHMSGRAPRLERGPPNYGGLGNGNNAVRLDLP